MSESEHSSSPLFRSVMPYTLAKDISSINLKESAITAPLSDSTPLATPSGFKKCSSLNQISIISSADSSVLPDPPSKDSMELHISRASRDSTVSWNSFHKDLGISKDSTPACDGLKDGAITSAASRDSNVRKLSSALPSAGTSLGVSAKDKSVSPKFAMRDVLPATSPKDASPKDVPTKDAAAKDIPAKDVAVKDVMENDLAANDVVEKDVAANDVVEKDVLANDVMDKDVAANDVVEKDVNANDAMEKEAAARDVVWKDVAANDVVGKDIDAKDIGEKDVATKDFVEKDVSTKEEVEKNVSMKEIVEKDVAAKNTMAKDVTIKEVVEEDVIAKEVMDKNFAAKDVAEKNVAPKEKVKKNVATTDIVAKDVAANDTPTPKDSFRENKTYSGGGVKSNNKSNKDGAATLSPSKITLPNELRLLDSMLDSNTHQFKAAEVIRGSRMIRNINVIWGASSIVQLSPSVNSGAGFYPDPDSDSDSDSTRGGKGPIF
ncbi:uncharacterized protein LOC111270617 [Varroa jacobsoni]|uniref:uncharacterized protein LOC111270617 n=1 Tax=Varroa jacobsoni TaxID=62625 RepID=UPI000BF2AC94|nr:uncharacterized protein LOC111270617 [Varroa jacobsoni]XP_022706668.1 uncharacterized protein LOC111270617 [Varroa jacobsoni]XP_022706669.1 uncharacterized protein LOC111270617 [Varroa jacobsoni]